MEEDNNNLIMIIGVISILLLLSSISIIISYYFIQEQGTDTCDFESLFNDIKSKTSKRKWYSTASSTTGCGYGNAWDASSKDEATNTALKVCKETNNSCETYKTQQN